MWVIMNDAFLSIVADRDDDRMLRVRARVAGDIERVFPFARIQVREHADYRYMALIRRGDVAGALIGRSIEIDYDNFKESVREPDRHRFYEQVWAILRRFGATRESRIA